MAATTATLIGTGEVTSITPGTSGLPKLGDSFGVGYGVQGDPRWPQYPDLVNIQSSSLEVIVSFKHDASAPDVNLFQGTVTGINNDNPLELGQPVAIYQEPSQNGMAYVSLEINPAQGGTQWVTGGKKE